MATCFPTLRHRSPGQSDWRVRQISASTFRCLKRFTDRRRDAPVRTSRIHRDLLLGAVMMLVHVGLIDHAERVHNAWLRAIEDGIHTYDIYDEKVSKQKVGTKEFADAVIERLGQTPQILKAREVSARARSRIRAAPAGRRRRKSLSASTFSSIGPKARQTISATGSVKLTATASNSR